MTTRRTFLKTAGAALGAGIGSQAITGFPTIWAQNTKDVVITHAGPSFSAIKAIAEKASEDLGFTIQIQNIETDLLGRILAQPTLADVVDLGQTTMRYLLGRGTLQTIPTQSWKYWDVAIPLIMKGEYEDGTKIPQQGTTPNGILYYEDEAGTTVANEQTEWMSFYPTLYNADTAGQRPDLMGRTSDTWSDLLNPELHGRVALTANPATGAMEIAMAMEGLGLITYGDKGNMTKDEIDFTLNHVIELKRSGHFRAFHTTVDQSVNLLASGETVMQSMISPAITEVRSRGIPAYYGPLKEGYRGWLIGMGVMSHVDGLKLDCVRAYADWYASGWQGAFIARQGYYSPVYTTVKEALTPAEWDYWYEGKPATVDILSPFGKKMESVGHVRDGGSMKVRMSNIGCWNSVMDEDRYLTRRWNEFVAG